MEGVQGGSSESAGEHKFALVNAEPLSPHLLASSHLENRSAEQKRKLAEAYYHLHREEVLLILRFLVAKREKQGNQAVKSALGAL